MTLVAFFLFPFFHHAPVKAALVVKAAQHPAQRLVPLCDTRHRSQAFNFTRDEQLRYDAARQCWNVRIQTPPSK